MKPRMKNVVLVFFLLALIFQSDSSAQTIYKSWIRQYDNPVIQGFIYQFNDTSLIISNDYSEFEPIKNSALFQTLEIAEIGAIKVRRRESVLKGVIIGTAAGALIGAIIGHSLGDDEPQTTVFGVLTDPSFTASQKAIMGGFAGSIFGAITGALIGFVKITIPIKGKKENFKTNEIQLRKYAYGYKE